MGRGTLRAARLSQEHDIAGRLCLLHPLGPTPFILLVRSDCHGLLRSWLLPRFGLRRRLPLLLFFCIISSLCDQQVFLDDHGLNEEHVDLVPVELGGVTLPHRVKVLDAVL